MQACVSSSCAISSRLQLTCRVQHYNVTVTVWCVSLVLKGPEADWQKLAPEMPVVQLEGGLRVCGVERSHPPELVASGAVWTSVSGPVILSSAAHYVTLTHPEVRKTMYVRREKAH